MFEESHKKAEEILESSMQKYNDQMNAEQTAKL